MLFSWYWVGGSLGWGGFGVQRELKAAFLVLTSSHPAVGSGATLLLSDSLERQPLGMVASSSPGRPWFYYGKSNWDTLAYINVYAKINHISNSACKIMAYITRAPIWTTLVFVRFLLIARIGKIVLGKKSLKISDFLHLKYFCYALNPYGIFICNFYYNSFLFFEKALVSCGNTFFSLNQGDSVRRTTMMLVPCRTPFPLF